MLTLLFDLLFPKHSLEGAEGVWMTDDERSRMQMQPLLLHHALLRKKGLKHIDAVIAAGRYDQSPLLQKAILTFKYRRISGLANDLALRMATATHGLLLTPEDLKGCAPVLCPVPLHWSRRYHRGFNQAALLAQGIGREKGWQTRELLRRVRPTGHQAWRSRAERLTALIDAFEAVSTVPEYVILVDDLTTTGATLDECAKALKKAGARQVAAIVAAYG